MRVLVVDDDRDIRESLRAALEFQDFEVVTADDGEQAIGLLGSAAPDAIVLDVMMPNVDGLTLCRRLRAAGDRTPILMLTARDALGDLITGLDAGADDYLAKPFALEELLARLRALLKLNRGTADKAADSVLRFADLELSTSTREVSRDGRPITLTRTEFDLLSLLMAAPKQVLTRSFLQQEVWGHESGTNTLDVYVGYLRRKIEEGGADRLVHTVRGVGYVLRSPS
ncbi:DNA-binding response regulator [Pseudonocardiaceae bacterium YIM PH 21723]|nr:DNA-binding response regulator [Pseudonocardiaceae bacterium YIM PH 21723]